MNDGRRRDRNAGTVALGLLIAVAVVSTATAAEPVTHRTQYRLHAALSLTAPQIEGTVEVRFTNDSRRTLTDVVFFLFPNRFALPDEGINDFNRPFLYPEEEFHPGAMDIVAARDDGRPVATEPLYSTGVPAGCLLRVPIAPLPPGAARTLSLRFRTTVPHRFGSFGEFERQLTLVGGWYPYLAALDDDGTWQTEQPPPPADFALDLTAAPELELVLNGRHLARAQSPVVMSVSAVHYLSLVAAPELLRDEVAAGPTRIVFFHRPQHHARRDTFEPSITDIMMATLRDAVARRPPGVPPPPDEMVVVEAPLRLNLTAPGEGAVVVSDRALKVHWLLRPFHELQLAQAVYAELLRPQVAARESPADSWWLSEGLSRLLAGRYVAQARPGTRSVQDWIELFNIFAVVDRFENAPKIPFVDAFFDRARVADPLGGEILTFNHRLPPGRVILGKLRDEVGAGAFDALIDRCLTDAAPFRRCAGAAAGRDLDWLFAQWLQPYPVLNYRLDAVDLNAGAAGAFRSTVTVRRAAARPIVEPVTVRLRSIGDRAVDVRWDGHGEVGVLTAETPQRVWQAIIDPERTLIEDRRDDNAWPPTPQVVLDSAEVEISSTEFGISGLLVGRARYDYHKDLAAAAFYTNRGIGVTAGGRWHWGTPIDPALYRHNIYLFYGFQALNSNFADARRPQLRTPGQVASLGVRYDYTNVFAFDNPTDERRVRLYTDWHDRGLGSDFDYVDWGVSLIATHPILNHRTIAAAEVLNGFSEPLGNSRVPNQGLYSLGGSRSIRGIGAEDQLGRNLCVLRTELRQDVYPELDLNFFDLLVLRRTQVRLFVDSGRVDNAAGRVYDVGHYAVGVGTGLAAAYEFLGFFPSLAYIEIATRVDDPHKSGDVQFLFGTRQAF